MWKNYKYYVKNLDCANCARKIEEGLEKKKYYKNVLLNFSKLTLSLETNLEGDVLSILTKDVNDIEQGVLLSNDLEEKISHRKDILLLGLGFLLFIISTFLHNFNFWQNFLCFLSYVVLGYSTFFKAVSLLRKGVLNENFLIVVSALGAFFIAKPNEGFMVLFLYQLGKYFEGRATSNVRKNVAELMQLKPTMARKKEKDSSVIISPDELKVGDVIEVYQGEKVPIDGVLCSETCELDTSSLTGEAKIVKKNFGEEVLSGSINMGVVFDMKVTSLYENSTVKRILDLMENASDRKAKVENFVNVASKYYTPLMLCFSLVVFLFSNFIMDISFSESLYRAFMVLVISCPCAIAISVPLCYFAGLGAMSKHGILVKGSNYIDALNQIQYFVFDKTGTLTTGGFGVIETKVLNPNYSLEEVLKYLVYGESYSNHPLAKSLLKEYSEFKIPKLSNVREIKGKGIKYQYNNHKVKLGNAKFVGSDLKISGSVIFVSVDEDIIGYVLMGDEIKDNAKEFIEKVHKLGIQTIMFTGDNQEIARDVSKRIGLGGYVAELLPDDKFYHFENIKRENPSKVVSFVGDGINDAPVLRLSDCGIGMGSGSESAIEASDVIIMSNDLFKILEAKKIARRTISILKENLIFALFTKVIVLISSLFGFGAMWIAVFADVGVTLLTICNSLRILR